MFGIFRKKGKEDKELRDRLRNILGFKPKNMAVYELAMTHSSTGQVVRQGVPLSNERLEFLGDAVLGAVVAKYLFKRFPFESEGFLTETRSKIVSRKHLGGLARKLGLHELIKKDGSMDRGESSLGGDALEALVGAAFLDRGFEETEQFIVNNLIDSYIDINQLLKEESNHKSRLIEWCQKQRADYRFEITGSSGGKHNQEFQAQIVVNGKAVGKGKGRTKKLAEQDAAKEACRALGVMVGEADGKTAP